jgi:hypothetical protein
MGDFADADAARFEHRFRCDGLDADIAGGRTGTNRRSHIWDVPRPDGLALR